MKIAICGSAVIDLPKKLLQKAKGLGEILAKQKTIVFTGATTGYGYEVAKAVRKYGGLTVGISPAESEQEHQQTYQLPLDAYQIIIYTGIGYKARDVLMIRSVEAAIFIGGGTGTLTEFCVAVDNHKVIGVLKGSGGATRLFKKIITVSHRVKPRIIEESNPEKLVKKVSQEVQKRKAHGSAF